jgi:hypothetical protein
MSTGACLGPEFLAALVERRIAASEERRSMLAHIASCADCYEAFAGTARFLDETAVQETPGGSSGSPWLVAAAAAVVMATGLLWWQLASGTALPQVTPSEAPLAHQATPPGSTTRRSGEPASPATAAWLRDAPWATAGRARNAFAPVPASKRDLLLGMHLAALGRACLGSGTKPDAAAIGEVGQSLRRMGAVAEAERLRLLAQAEAHDCELAPAARAGPWLEMGRALEQWRIAVVEKDKAAFDAARARRFGALVERVHLEGAALPLAKRLSTRRSAPEDGNWDVLASDLDDLIELLCA